MMTRSETPNAAFGQRLNKASGWNAWNSTYPGVGRLFFNQFISADEFHDAYKIFETALANHPTLGMAYNGNCAYAPGKPVLSGIYQVREGELGFCLAAATSEDMDHAITLFETDLRPVLRGVMRKIALGNSFLSATLTATLPGEHQRLSDAFVRAGDRAGIYAMPDLPPGQKAAMHETRIRLQKDAGKFRTIEEMLGSPECPEIFKTVIRDLVPVLNDPAPKA